MNSSFNLVAACVRGMTVLALVCVMSACSSLGSVKSSTNATLNAIGDKADKALTQISEKTNIGNNPDDPLEGYNRIMFGFNEGIDEAILKPVAKGYQSFLPEFIQAGIGNFFSNIGDIWTSVNNLLQGKVEESATDLLRIALNTTFGIGGVIDVASKEGLPKHLEDFGQTLGVWGVGPGPYFILPLIGPSTVRDALATPIDFKGDILLRTKPLVRNTTSVLRVIDKRAAALDATNLIEEAALDKYVFIRAGHLQRRAAQVNPEGNSDDK
jgi:phospholipid-binding lipoprotein MlaA